MNTYKIPDEYFFRLNHVRPRFKNDIEEVLLYTADAISGLPEQAAESFENSLFAILKAYKQNSFAKDKTIDNWRTEISALFSFIKIDEGLESPAQSALRLSKNRNLCEFFNYFLLTFQYPGGHVKPKTIIESLKKNVRFKPCKFILDTLVSGGCDFYVTSEEITQCAYYDLRVLQGERSAKEVSDIIKENRQKGVQYDHKYSQLKKNGNFPSKGDLYRYAGDILDYMVLANLLIYKTERYYLNKDYIDAINFHISSDSFFTDYDRIDLTVDEREISSEVKKLESRWIDYSNSFDNIKEFISGGQKEQLDLDEIIRAYYEHLKGSRGKNIATKFVGDYGEWIILAHEINRTKSDSKRKHLITKIPTPLGVGYDLQSIEIGEKKRYIEVKTTRAKKFLAINSFNITPNEWDTAKTLGENYYIYYLLINESSNLKRLFIIKNPVEQYQKGNINVCNMTNGSFNLKFDDEKAGIWSEVQTI